MPASSGDGVFSQLIVALPLVCQVTEMAVSEGFRRRGVASGLLKAVDEHAKELGIPFICLFVETKNRSAIELYLKVNRLHWYHLHPRGSPGIPSILACSVLCDPTPMPDLSPLLCGASLPGGLPLGAVLAAGCGLRQRHRAVQWGTGVARVLLLLQAPAHRPGRACPLHARYPGRGRDGEERLWPGEARHVERPRSLVVLGGV